jgi:hypothetical protein
MRKSKHWLARNRDNVSEWGDMSVRGLVSVSYHYKNSTKRVGLVQDLIIISLKINYGINQFLRFQFSLKVLILAKHIRCERVFKEMS